MKPTQDAYSEIEQAYDHFNATLFGGKLPRCLITLQRDSRCMGYFSATRFAAKNGSCTDEIAMNPEYFAVTPLLETLQTLVHEMVHLWQHHFGKPSRSCYHNREWADKMEEVGLTPTSTGKPGGKKTGQTMADYATPGGPFLKAVDQLMSKGFQITWYDRFPPAKFTTTSVMPEVRNEASAVALSVAADEGVKMVVRTPVEQGESDGSATGTNVTIGRSNRAKYQCRGCHVNVWGKPRLRIACMECDQEMVVMPG